jgi:hypothetical protein
MINIVATFIISKHIVELSEKKSGVSLKLHYSGTALQSHSGTAKEELTP